MDEGAKYVNENFENVLQACRNDSRFSEFARTVAVERGRCHEIELTGDFLRYFRRVIVNNSKQGSDFAKLHQAYPDCLPYEELIAYLENHYSEEKDHTTHVSDLVIGKRYSSFTLMAFFGGSYQSSYAFGNDSGEEMLLVKASFARDMGNEWDGGDFIYSPMRRGASPSENFSKYVTERKILLFVEREKKRGYRFEGCCQYIKTLNDGRVRLRLIDDGRAFVPGENGDFYPIDDNPLLKEQYDQAMEEARHKGLDIPERRAPSAQLGRDRNVILYSKLAAKGICDLCGNPAPFKTKDGAPYLECHHIRYIRYGGADNIYNVVGLCPNCHRKVHSLKLEADKKKLIKQVKKHLKDAHDEDNLRLAENYSYDPK